MPLLYLYSSLDLQIGNFPLKRTLWIYSLDGAEIVSYLEISSNLHLTYLYGTIVYLPQLYIQVTN